jgi:hypothetical protein
VRSTTLASASIETRTENGWTFRRTAQKDTESGRAAGAPAASRADFRGREERTYDHGAVAGSGPSTGGGAPRPPEAPAPSPAAPPGGEPAMDPGGEPADAAKRKDLDLSEAKSVTAEKSMPQYQRQLRAGATDDNEEFPRFLEFLSGWGSREGMTGRWQPVDVRDRRFVRVVDGAGRPIPAASVAVVDAERDRVVGRGMTYGDGRAPIYPRAAVAAGDDGHAPPSGWIVDVQVAGETVRTTWDGANEELTVTVGAARAAPDLVPIDVAFLIDTTGSMGDEIASIQASLLKVTEQIRSLSRESDLRVGTVLYRDLGDEYLTATWPLTADVGSLDRALRGVRADGGGDGPESLNQGLAETVDGLQWREGAAKVAFLVADAPPHMDYAGDTPYGDTCRAAVAKGLRVHTVAASGLDEVGSLVFRQIAQFTRGKFVFIEYGGSIDKSAAKHGVAGAVKNDNLEDILFEQIRDEVARWGRGRS